MDYSSNSKNPSADDIYDALLSQLTGESTKKPRIQLAANLWRKDKKDVIEAEVIRRLKQAATDEGRLYSSSELKKIGGFREKVFREMFSALSQEVKDRWAERAKKEFEAAMAKWKREKARGPSDKPMDRQKCIQRLVHFVQPILDGLCSATGWKFSLIAGGPEPAHDGRLNILSIHSGTTSGDVKLNFGGSEARRYRKHVVPVYAEFLKKCYTAEECRACALPKDRFKALLDMNLEAAGVNFDSVGIPGVHDPDDGLSLQPNAVVPAASNHAAFATERAVASVHPNLLVPAPSNHAILATEKAAASVQPNFMVPTPSGNVILPMERSVASIQPNLLVPTPSWSENVILPTNGAVASVQPNLLVPGSSNNAILRTERATASVQPHLLVPGSSNNAILPTEKAMASLQPNLLAPAPSNNAALATKKTVTFAQPNFLVSTPSHYATVPTERAVAPVKPNLPAPAVLPRERAVAPVKPNFPAPTVLSKERAVEPIKPTFPVPAVLPEERAVAPVKPNFMASAVLPQERAVTSIPSVPNVNAVLHASSSSLPPATKPRPSEPVRTVANNQATARIAASTNNGVDSRRNLVPPTVVESVASAIPSNPFPASNSIAPTTTDYPNQPPKPIDEQMTAQENIFASDTPGHLPSAEVCDLSVPRPPPVAPLPNGSPLKSPIRPPATSKRALSTELEDTQPSKRPRLAEAKTPQARITRSKASPKKATPVNVRTPAVASPRTPALRSKGSKVLAMPDDAPSWFQSAMAMLSANDLGAEWKALLQRWLAFELACGFQQASTLETKDRPAAVGQWIKRARSSTWRPTIKDAKSYGNWHMKWWGSLQPDWRLSENNELLMGKTKGDWERLRKPGVNGILSVLVSLFYWGLNVKRSTREGARWSSAVADCSLCLSQLI